MNNRLYVGNLAYSVNDESLVQQFSRFGSISSAKIMMDRDTGRSKGFGFVEMDSEAHAQAAIDELNGKMWDGRALTVNIARPMEQRSRVSDGTGRGGATEGATIDGAALMVSSQRPASAGLSLGPWRARPPPCFSAVRA
ncbi:RNA recognition motif domain-containing protein [Paenacidovorax monticola]|uniref:RNA-binding protein n=1 Tax=Paenacidovorax monticola TaxID=1926868 RepID=A0A7H0HJ16_9BURK|nr:RNA-binding protein [Paenacidovorax monticola]QNP60532.1 RNA-binding protein [Paenacidovorax monticola]